MIRGVIVEGMSTAGKTSVFKALKKLHNQLDNGVRTLLTISEHYSQVLHSNHGVLETMKKEEHIQLLRRHVDYLEQQSNWIDSLGQMKSSHGIFFVLERFHVNHRAAFQDSLEISQLENQLLKLNARCLLLTLSKEAVGPRFIKSRGVAWESYVLENHASESEACQKFLEEQEKLRMVAKQSLIPTLEINTDAADWESYARQILVELNSLGMI
ncbi:hypothetical protein LOZ80_14030 [Paenibacillus sp. HWE-109]|uniref:hypothetical protein n=1 Tax=Paenibacillus sp. HWE-109 TaxID=1306526 RepID=UPI001EDDDBEE|nr:hypothetical protein [Paenibacillus sp. HWE-109]UKS29986.1 hypothetical protein LOZ80_14030 [Paenibacillus sp. HWE-109]